MGPAVEISKIACLTGARDRLAAGRLTFEVAGMDVDVPVSHVQTPLGTTMWLLVCPACQRRCRKLYVSGEGGLWCSRCVGLRHPDQRTSGSERGRTQRCVQQIRRLEARLACRGPDRATRRRLRRRRQRLMLRLAGVLACRRIRLWADLDRAVLMAKRGTQ